VFFLPLPINLNPLSSMAQRFVITGFNLSNVKTKPSRVTGMVLNEVQLRVFTVYDVPSGIDITSVDGPRLSQCSLVNHTAAAEQHLIGQIVTLSGDNGEPFSIGRLLRVDSASKQMSLFDETTKVLHQITPSCKQLLDIAVDGADAEQLSRLIKGGGLRLSLKAATDVDYPISFDVRGWKAEPTYSFTVLMDSSGDQETNVKVTVGFSVKNRDNSQYDIRRMSYTEYKLETPRVVADYAEPRYSRALSRAAPTSALDAAPEVSSSSKKIEQETVTGGGTTPVVIGAVFLTPRSTTYIQHKSIIAPMQFYFLGEISMDYFTDVLDASLPLFPVLKQTTDKRRELVPFSGKQRFSIRGSDTPYDAYTRDYNVFDDTSAAFYVRMPKFDAVSCLITNDQSKRVVDDKNGTRTEYYKFEYRNLTGMPAVIKHVIMPLTGRRISTLEVLNATASKFKAVEGYVKEQESDAYSNGNYSLTGVLPVSTDSKPTVVELKIFYKN
jgi:hypothetical protein